MMENKVIIAADSTCDLSPDLIERYDIKIIPLPVNLGSKPCLDGVDVNVDDVFNYFEETGELATTSAPTVEYYEDFYRKWTDEGYTVVHTSISLKFTITHNIAQRAAEKFPGVYPIDSHSISSGMGLLAIRAAQLRDQGLAAWEIAEHLRTERDKINVSFVLDTLKYMRKGGRCSGIAALGANMLNLKPCLETKDAMLVVKKKYRGKLENVFLQYVEETLASVEDIDKSVLIIAHSGVDKRLLDAVKSRCTELADFKEIYECKTGCSVSVHCGPNTLGIVFSRIC